MRASGSKEEGFGEAGLLTIQSRLLLQGPDPQVPQTLCVSLSIFRESVSAKKVKSCFTGSSETVRHLCRFYDQSVTGNICRI